MAREIIVGAGQIGPGIGPDLKENVGRLNELLKKGGDLGVNILSFTEIGVVPFFPITLLRDYERYCLEFPDEILAPLFETAKKYRMVLILPFAEKDGIDYFNSAVIADMDGTILGKYRKVTLPSVFPSPQKGSTGTYEKLYFKPGNLGFPVFHTGYGKIGIQICYDRKFPEGSRILALEGAEIIVIPSCTTTSTYGDFERQFASWDLSSRARAYENGVFVVFANKAGQESAETVFGTSTVTNVGRSLIINPQGETIATGSPDQWEIVMTKIDLEEVQAAQKVLPFWRDRRPCEYGRLVQK